MSRIIFVFALTVLLFLSVYGATYFYISINYLFRNKNKKTIKNKLKLHPNDQVLILIPVHREGDSVIDTIESLIHQKYAGFIEIRLLIKDRNDPTFNAVKNKYGIKNQQETVTYFNSSKKRSISLVETSFGPKREKLNSQLDSIEAEFLAILDADHCAAEDWLRNSIEILKSHQDVVAVQSRRNPLSVGKICQLWDSIQGHIGNEVVNNFLDQKNQSVMFTGTTCVFKTSVFESLRFAECLTEDTYLSYDLIINEKCSSLKIAYNNETGSYEQLAPDFKSYVSRRRRWSAGHSRSFIDHLKLLFKIKMPFFEKAKNTLHGLFYFIGPAVVLLLILFAIPLFFQLPITARIYCFGISIIISGCLVHGLVRKYYNYFIDGIVTFLFVYPLVIDLTPLYYRFFNKELYHSLISFPYGKEIGFLQIILVIAPLVVTIIGNIYLKIFRWVEIGYLFLSYPLFLFLDIYATTLGFFDFLFKNNVWTPTTRDASVQQNVVPEAVIGRTEQNRQVTRPISKYIALILLLVGAVLMNDLLVNPNCGDEKVFLFQPLIFKQQSESILIVEHNQIQVDQENFETKINIRFSQPRKKEIKLQYFIDGLETKNINFTDLENESVLPFIQKFGWGKKKLLVKLSGDRLSCSRESWISERMLEIKGQDLFINGEPFLIKGIIPSFSSARVNLSMQKGLNQIKRTGANVIRFYHHPSNEARDQAEKENLLIIDQPDESTWNNEQIQYSYGQKNLLYRYKKLDREFKNFPFTLFHNLGNELEFGFGDSSERISAIDDMLLEISKDPNLGRIFSYSTYRGFHNYLNPILGVNMLDTSETYWTKNLNLIRSYNKPFYASEFGGFVADTEKPSSIVRTLRIKDYWNRLINSKAAGAVFFQSHDNWAQPIVEGINDPTIPDLPDDERGIWDERNNPKFELLAVKEIFSDFKIVVPEKLTITTSNEFEITLINQRRFRLENVTIEMPTGHQLELGNFEAGQAKLIHLPIGIVKHTHIYLDAYYTTHHGLRGQSSMHFQVPISTEHPAVLSNEYLESHSSANQIKGVYFSNDKLKIIFPKDWKNFNLNGKSYVIYSSPTELELAPVFLKPESVFHSIDGKSWTSLDLSHIKNGNNFLRIKIPKKDNRHKFLVLAGLGSSRLKIHVDEKPFVTLESHPYREMSVPLDDFEGEQSKELIIQFERDFTLYLDRQLDPTLPYNIEIDLEPPTIFAPHDLIITN